MENYKGRADQIERVMEQVTIENYIDMCQRVNMLEVMDTITGSSNFGRFMKWFKSNDSGWIDEINENIE